MRSTNSGARSNQIAPAKEVRMFASLAEIARLINSSTDLPALLNRVATAVCQHSSWASCGIMSVNRKAGLSELVVRFDPRLDPATKPPTSWKLQESATMRVIETNQPVIIPDAQVCEEFLAYRADALLRGYRTVVILPLGSTDSHGQEMTIAMHSREVVPVSDTELAFLTTVAQLASIAVEKAKRVQLEQDRTHRLRRTIEISTELMENVLAEHSMEAVVGMVAAVLSYPFIIVDLAAESFSVRRSPTPRVLSEGEWKRIVADKLRPAIMDMIRTAGATGQRTGSVLAIGLEGLADLQPMIEPLQVNGNTVGGLIIFPPAGGVDDLDEVLIHASRLALDVQLMRDYVRFRSEANSVAEIFKTIFAGSPQHPADLVARARRLGVSLPGPARLVTIGFPNEHMESAELQVANLQLSLARAAADIVQGSAVIPDDDLVIFAPVPAKGGAAGWEEFLRRIATTAESLVGVEPIIAESRICRRLQDYREARLEGGRVLAMSRMFGKAGRTSQTDFGPFALLLSTIDHTSARAFVRGTLGAIEDYDRRCGTDLLQTLRQFLRDGCRYQACAKRMGIHVSTLRYRLERLHELFGIEPGKPDSAFGLTLALRLRELENDAPLQRLQQN
jgi:DNA-binding PucR family transcriptional regulator